MSITHPSSEAAAWLRVGAEAKRCAVLCEVFEMAQRGDLRSCRQRLDELVFADVNLKVVGGEQQQIVVEFRPLVDAEQITR
jgi:hypothetical protein